MKQKFSWFIAIVLLVLTAVIIGGCVSVPIIADPRPVIILPTSKLEVTPNATDHALSTPRIIHQHTPGPTTQHPSDPVATPQVSASPYIIPGTTLVPTDPTTTPDLNEPTADKIIAFTFDDGPGKVSTNRILDVLEANGATATFFVIGQNLEYYPNTVRRAYQLGCEIGNHTYGHKYLNQLSAAEIHDQIDRVDEMLLDIIGIKSPIFRPPGGKVDKNTFVVDTVGKPCIMWSVDTKDWKLKDRDAIIENVLSSVRDGDIVLMHDIYSSTADAVEYLVPELINRGYSIVSVSKLFELKGKGLQNEVYRHAR